MIVNFVLALVLACSALLYPIAAPGAARTENQPAAEAAAYALSHSKSANRTAASALHGVSVSGNIYVFVSPESGAKKVDFYIDNPAASGTAYRTEGNAPWDLAGGTATTAAPFDTRTLSDGSHSVTAAITLSSGSKTLVTANFNVNNAAGVTNTPAPTATATNPATATPTKPTTATPQSGYTNMVSKSANRAAASALNGQSVGGNIYVFVSPESGATKVEFYIDNPAASGTAYRTEGNAPFDLAGGTVTTATPFDTCTLSNGAHSVTAAITLSSGGRTLTTANFTVNNSTATSTPAPTATKQATATPTKQATATATKQPTATPTKQPTATTAPASGSIYWGVSMSGIPGDNTKLTNWERDVAGKGVSIIHWGHKWADSSNAYRAWSNSAANSARNHGSIPMISWTPQGGDNSKFQLSDIINGAHDTYIRQFATSIKSWSYPVMLRIGHEMNGAWDYPWQEDENGNSRGQFVPAWRHIVDIFRQQGVTNVSYVWCPSADWNGSPRPSYASLYPGDSYVDWTCLDGYNFGTNANEGWQTWDQVYNYSYNEVLKVAASKPMIIGEFGSVENGGSKANWFTDALKTQIPSRYTKIRAAVYFNWDMGGDDWRIETSTASKDAWRAGIASSYYYANQFGSITGKVAVP